MKADTLKRDHYKPKFIEKKLVRIYNYLLALHYLTAYAMTALSPPLPHIVCWVPFEDDINTVG